MERFSLGKVACRWIQENLAVPDGPKYGQPLRLSRRQAGIISAAFTFEPDGDGFSRVRDRVLYVGPKGEGKSPMAAMLAAFTLAGPCVPVDVDGDGWLVGRPDPSALVQIFANSEKQGKRTTWRPLQAMLKGGPLSDEIFIGKTFMELGDASINYEASSPDSAEGPRTDLAICEETQYWRDRDMVNLWDTIVRNLGKKDGFAFAPTNAPARGGASIADQLIQSDERGDDPALYVFYPRLDEPVESIKGAENREEVMDALRFVFGDSADPDTGWVQLNNVYKKLQSAPEAKGRRYYLNESAKFEGRMIDADLWDSWAQTGVKIPDGQFVVLGFDGSEAEDATALVAVSCTEVPHVQTINVWQRPPETPKELWKVPKGEVLALLNDARERWKIEAVVADPSIAWKSFIRDLADDTSEGWGDVTPGRLGDRTHLDGWGLVCEIWMNNSPKLTDAVTSHLVGLLEPEEEGAVSFTHDGVLSDAAESDVASPQHLLTRQSLAMLKTTMRNGTFASVGKESQAEKDQIDAGVALMLGLWGAAQFPARDAARVAAGDGQDAINARLRGSVSAAGDGDAQSDINARLRGR